MTKLALENSGREFTLSISDYDVNNARIRLLVKDSVISISDFGSSLEYERELLPIYFPIDMGLDGWRVFVIHQDSVSRFSDIDDLTGLRQLTAGQGIGWADVDLLENAELSVSLAPNLSNLFRMLDKNALTIYL